MECKIFYSWQSDLPSQTNEQFIEVALKNVAQKLEDDSALDVIPIFDRDIANVPGSPEIARTILAKIEQSDIFVADVSIINKRQLRNNTKTKKIRPTPNPNVLVELGFALKSLGPDKIVLVNNLAFGKHEELPFDFRHRYIVGYNLAQDDLEEKRETERQTLEMQLELGLLKIISNLNNETIKKSNPCDEAIAAIKNSQPNQAILISEFVDWMMVALDKSAPPFPNAEGNELDLILNCVDQTVGIVSDFTRLFSMIANFSSSELPSIYKRVFERILAEYNPPIDFTGSSYVGARFQFYKFIGHELFITLIALLFEAEKLGVIADILEETLYVENDRYIYPDAQNVSYSYISMTGESSMGIRKSMINPLAEKLFERHSEGELAEFMPSIRLVDADYFLFLRNGKERWSPVLNDKFMPQTPKFLIRATKNSYAQKLLRPLAVSSIEEFKSLFVMESKRMFQFRWRFGFDPSKIASE